MSTLEPTDEQLDAVAEAVLKADELEGASHCTQCYADSLRAAWPVIRDMVLEAAAKECELPQAEDDWVPAIAQECADAIRQMKGKQP